MIPLSSEIKVIGYFPSLELLCQLLDFDLVENAVHALFEPAVPVARPYDADPASIQNAVYYLHEPACIDFFVAFVDQEHGTVVYVNAYDVICLGRIHYVYIKIFDV